MSLFGQFSPWAWDLAVQWSRGLALSALQGVKVGHLKIVDVDGTVTDCGNEATTPSVTLKVLQDVFWIRLVLEADMGFAESYMLGEISCPDLTEFFELFIINRESLGNGSTMASSIASILSGLLQKSNTLSSARLNIAAHYDISNEMFAAFLSPDMTYSCPIWAPKSSPNAQLDSLEEAQYRKLNRIIDLAHIKSTDHVLEIGTGWGSFAITAVQRTGCRVTSITLSEKQKVLAEEKIAQAGLQDRISVQLCDYRTLTAPEPFDKVVSIEMLEAVGKEWLETYFRCVDKLLKKNGGIAVFQCITMPEARYEAYARSTDFIRKYIFPGGHLPTVTQLVSSVAAGANNSLILDVVENIGGHYAKTLRLWKEEFCRNFDASIAPALGQEHKTTDPKDAEIFKRKWQYYFSYCEAGFATKTLGDVIFAVSREGAEEVLEEVPL